MEAINFIKRCILQNTCAMSSTHRAIYWRVVSKSNPETMELPLAINNSLIDDSP